MKDFEAYISDLREVDSPLIREMEEFAKDTQDSDNGSKRNGNVHRPASNPTSEVNT